mgnify:CR=1 FL=1
MKILNYLCTVFALLLWINTEAQLTVTSGNPATAIVDTLVGTGVSVSNVTYTGNASSKGTFRCTGGCNLGISRGVFLSTGNAGQTPTSPPSDFHSSDMSASGDAQLNLIVSPNLTQDAAVLEFDFTPAADSIGFKFVFASEEYNDYVNTAFNDVFAFYISGPGIPGSPKNLALIPGTSIPVSINNVNNGYSAGAATGPCNHCTYFVDNVPNGGTANFFDGFTTVISAGIKVMPCQTYHMKFAIADVNDGVFDSGVFLEAKSFSSIGNVGIVANGVQIVQNLDTVYACDGDSVVLTASPAGSYNWNNGQTTQTIVVTQANITPSGVYQYAVLNSSPACFASSKQVKVIFVIPTATITPLGSTALCPGGSVVLQANPGSSYLWSNGATSDSIVVSAAGTYTVTVTQFGNCSAVSTPVIVTQSAPAAAINGVLTICSGNNTTLTATAGTSYQWSTGASTQSISVGTSNVYTVTVTYSGGCTATASVNVTANTNPVPSITGNNSICQGQSSTINAGSYAGYSWSTGATTATINVNTTGNYSVTVTDANGCTGTASFNLAVNANPTPTITGVTSFCAGGNSTLNAGGGYTNYLWSGGATTQTINVTAAGNYAVTVTNTAGCTATTNKLITVNALPVPSVTGALAFCAGKNTSLTVPGSYTSYQWSTGATTSNITVSTASTFTVTVTDANGCTGSKSATTTINTNPVPSITGNNSICQGQSSTINAGSYAGYSWSTGATTATINVNTTGNYSVTVTDANGCTGTASFNLAVNANPTPTITGVTSFCAGGNSTLNAGGGYTNYLWSGGATTQTINVTAAGNYAVTVTNAAGCTATTNKVITVNALPVPVISGLAGICPGASANLATGSFASYLWSNGNTTSSITTSVSGNYTVTVTDINGCIGSSNYNLLAFQNPVPVISGTAAICQNQSSVLDAGSFASWQWSTGAVSQTISVNQSGTYSVTVTNVDGCVASTSFNVVVNPIPVPVISGTSAFCSGNSSVFNTGGGSFASYQWNTSATTSAITVTAAGNYVVTVTDANGCTASTSQAATVWNLPTPVITGNSAICSGTQTTLSAGNYSTFQWSTGATTDSISVSNSANYIVTVTDVNGCTGISAPFALTINQLPSAIISGTAAICIGQSTALQFQFTGTAPYSYRYSDGTSVSPIMNSNNTTAQILVSPGITTDYTLTQISDVNCTGSVSGVARVVVNPLPQPIISGSAGECEGITATLTTGNFAAYLWSTGATSQSISINTSGSYVCTVTSTAGCKASTSHNFESYPLPIVSFTNDSSLTCELPIINFTNTSQYQLGSVFEWNIDNVIYTTQNATHQFSGSGNYPVSLTITTLDNCVAEATRNVNITVFPLPQALYSVNPENAPLFNSEVTFADGSANAVSWLWDFGDGDTSSLQNVSHFYADPGKYNAKLYVTNVAGCIDSSAREIFITPFYIPNAFTPNGDGRNETFFDPGYATNVQDLSMNIYNRWGQLVYTSDNLSTTWDGTDSKGNLAPQGVYIYALKVTTYSGKHYDYTGSVTLLR